MEQNELLFRFHSAVRHLQMQKSLANYQIVAIINERLPPKKGKKVFISTPNFSRYYSANETSKINTQTLAALCKALDEYIVEQTKHRWNQKTEKYELIDTSKDNVGNTLRLEGLFGIWEVYTWDEESSQKTGHEFIHCFKLRIHSLDNIECSTKFTTFTTAAIDFIGTEKVSLELSNPTRKVSLIICIGTGLADELRKRKQFYSAYIDSGNINVKAGLAVIRRSDFDYEEIIPESKLLSAVEAEKPIHLINFIKGKQFVIS